MQAKQLREEGGQKTFVLVFDTGEETVSGLTEFARERGLDATGFTAIGVFGAATLGYFDLEEKEYQKVSGCRRHQRRSEQSSWITGEK